MPQVLRRLTRWRAALGVVVGLLLPVPLLLLLGSVTQAKLQQRSPEEARVSPVLSFEERMRRVTYERDCKRGSDCEPPLACLSDVRLRTRYCTDSECTTDDQCPEGQTCQSLPTVDNGPLVRYCIPLGVRKEGEGCYRPPGDKESACGPGLVCAGKESWCGRPCRKDEAGSCPEGFFCAGVAPQPACLPTCRERGCPEGQHCVLFEEDVSRCAVVYGPNCQQYPCPQGRECDVFEVADQPDKVWMECVERCGEGWPPCPTGRACDMVRCQPACDPQAPGTCGAGYRCDQRKPGTPWVCLPDV